MTVSCAVPWVGPPRSSKRYFSPRNTCIVEETCSAFACNQCRAPFGFFYFYDAGGDIILLYGGWLQRPRHSVILLKTEHLAYRKMFNVVFYIFRYESSIKTRPRTLQLQAADNFAVTKSNPTDVTGHYTGKIRPTSGGARPLYRFVVGRAPSTGNGRNWERGKLV